MLSHLNLSPGSEDDLPTLLEFLHADPSPSIVIPIDSLNPVPFHIAFANDAFRAAHLEELIRAGDAISTAFRTWMQTIAHWREIFELNGCSWTAFTVKQKWKVARMRDRGTPVRSPPPASTEPKITTEIVDPRKSPGPTTLAAAQLRSLMRMMEMSDVGVFEYSPEGTLLRANDSWFKLSRHPGMAHMSLDFSFMDLVYPDDAAIVVSQWNKLVQNEPVTFEVGYVVVFVQALWLTFDTDAMEGAKASLSR